MRLLDGYQLRTKKKKEQIRKAAIELFINFGVEKVSLADISKKANVSPVTIYNHFGTKDELVRNVVISFLEEQFENRLKTAKRKDINFAQKIEKMIFDTSEISGIDPNFLNTLISGDSELQRMLEGLYAKYMPVIIEFFEEGKSSGYIDSDVSTESIIIYINILQKAMGEFEFSKDNDKNSKLAKDMSKFFFYGLLKKPEK